MQPVARLSWGCPVYTLPGALGGVQQAALEVAKGSSTHSGRGTHKSRGVQQSTQPSKAALRWAVSAPV